MAEDFPKETPSHSVSITAHRDPPLKSSHGPRFWGIFVSLCLLSFISALDVAIITTALPKVTADIGSTEQDYVWIANSFVVASSVVQPLCGQLADIFGRRIPLLVSTMLFALGSGIAGGANSVDMMIAGRTVQGVGAGGVYVLLDIVCCDLVPLRERGKYLGLMNSWAGVAAGIGPVVGGVLADSNWRWM
jgi:MFS family permease